MDQHGVARARRGDSDAIEALVVGHHDRHYRVAHGIQRDPHLAEDATQQAFLDVWQEIRRLRDPAKFEAWSYRLLVRVCYREAKRKPDWTPESDLSPAEVPLAADQYGSVAHRDQLERGFRQLSMDHRTVIVLHHLLDMTLEAVPDTLEIPQGTSHSRLCRAMRALSAAMKPSETRTSEPAGQQVAR